jgi:hypothetical protein
MNSKTPSQLETDSEPPAALTDSQKWTKCVELGSIQQCKVSLNETLLPGDKNALDRCCQNGGRVSRFAMLKSLLRFFGVTAGDKETQEFEPIYGLPSPALDAWLSRNPKLTAEYQAKLRTRAMVGRTRPAGVRLGTSR